MGECYVCENKEPQRRKESESKEIRIQKRKRKNRKGSSQ